MKTKKRPNAFGHPHYPSFDFHISHGTVQVWPIHGNAALYGRKFKEFQRWLDKVQEYADFELARHLVPKKGKRK